MKYFSLIWAQLFRSRTRTLFTLLSVVTAFLLFGICMIGQLIWVIKVMPETKGVPLEEMEKQLGVAYDPNERPPSRPVAGH